MDSTNVMRQARGGFITGHASPHRGLHSIDPVPCEHPPVASRQCYRGQEPSDAATKSAEFNGSVMAAVDYHRKHLLTDHDCGQHECVHPRRRARSNTVPTALLRRLRNGAEAEESSVHATADGPANRRDCNQRAPSLESLEARDRRQARMTRRDEIVLAHMKDKHPDQCPLYHRRSSESVLTSSPPVVSPVPPSEELSAVTLLDHCMDAADDEFYTVYRDPLPKGSSVFEKVITLFRSRTRLRSFVVRINTTLKVHQMSLK